MRIFIVIYYVSTVFGQLIYGTILISKNGYWHIQYEYNKHTYNNMKENSSYYYMMNHLQHYNKKNSS